MSPASLCRERLRERLSCVGEVLLKSMRGGMLSSEEGSTCKCNTGGSYASLPMPPIKCHRLDHMIFILWSRFVLDGKPCVSGEVSPAVIYVLNELQQ